MRVPPHDVPDQAGPPIFDHRQDRPLVDAERVAVELADPGDAPAVLRLHLARQGGIERVEEALLGKEVLVLAAGISSIAGIAIPGTKAMEEVAAVGAMVPSSRISPRAAPHRVMKWIFRPSISQSPSNSQEL